MIERTGKPYVYDLCDAYNARRTRDDVEWTVSHSGELHMQFVKSSQRTKDELDRRAEEKRQTWIHRHNHPERYI